MTGAEMRSVLAAARPTSRDTRLRLIADLEAYADPDFHRDRELSDRVLLADGWTFEADARWAGGFAWHRGTNPRVTVSEATRPHPVQEIGAALGTIPAGCDFRVHWSAGNRATGSPPRAVVAINPVSPKPACSGHGEHAEMAIAVVIAALRFMIARDDAAALAEVPVSGLPS